MGRPKKPILDPEDYPCSRCGTEFVRERGGGKRRNTWCPACKSLSVKEYWRQQRAKFGRHPGGYPGYWVKKYGITYQQVQALHAQQGGKCALCERPIRLGVKGKDGAAVDHCHNTKEVRGLLCMGCNTGLGNLQDSLDVLERAIRYLRRFAAM